MTVRDSLGLPKEGIPNLIAMATPLPIPWALKGWGLAGAKQEIAATELSSANTGEHGNGYLSGLPQSGLQAVMAPSRPPPSQSITDCPSL